MEETARIADPVARTKPESDRIDGMVFEVVPLQLLAYHIAARSITADLQQRLVEGFGSSRLLRTPCVGWRRSGGQIYDLGELIPARLEFGHELLVLRVAVQLDHAGVVVEERIVGHAVLGDSP